MNGPQKRDGFQQVQFVSEAQPSVIRSLALFYGRVIALTDLGAYMMNDDGDMMPITPEAVVDAVVEVYTQRHGETEQH